MIWFLFATMVFATEGVESLFLEKYPEVRGTDLQSCKVCHNPVGPDFLNPYSKALKESGLDFSKIESADSDGDGASNLVEIQNKSYPGSQAQMDEIYLFNNKKGQIRFDHLRHSVDSTHASSGKCLVCHSDGKFPRAFDDRVSQMQKGHADCRGCHQEQNKARGTEKAPTKCDGCHTGAGQ